MPIAGGGGVSLPGASVQDRVNAHNLDRQRDVAGRMSREWSEFDPGLQLFDHIGDGKQRVWERARDFEVQRHGSGLWYIAHAIERASGGRYTAEAIMAGALARSRANGEAARLAEGGGVSNRQSLTAATGMLVARATPRNSRQLFFGTSESQVVRRSSSRFIRLPFLECAKPQR